MKVRRCEGKLKVYRHHGIIYWEVAGNRDEMSYMFFRFQERKVMAGFKFGFIL